MSSLDSPQLFIMLLVLAGLVYGGWVFYENSQSEIPDQQVDKTDTRGFPPHRLNLWTEPTPPQTGQNTFSVEIDFVNLMNKRVDSVRYRLINSENQNEIVRKTEAEYRSSGAYKGRYTAQVKIPTTGQWLLEVESRWNKRRSNSTFEFDVKN